MKAESMQLFTIPITQNYQGVPFGPNGGDASHMCVLICRLDWTESHKKIIDRRLYSY